MGSLGGTFWNFFDWMITLSVIALSGFQGTIAFKIPTRSICKKFLPPQALLYLKLEQNCHFLDFQKSMSDKLAITWPLLVALRSCFNLRYLSRHSISGAFNPPSSYSDFKTERFILSQTCNLLQSLLQTNLKINLSTKTSSFCKMP